ncbi:26S proteasome non-ATPase regulatory subunit [Polyrhizophydium stewartii]|uniref:26S proteasome non-ATPase regulatory subunit n=1 Tax=Polyrhizophydium stewartii TaxID=2732419 RepID=A0ABR4N8R4_9FUNG
MTDMEADPAPAVPELTPEQKAAAALATALADIKSAVGLVERGVSSLESRFVTRALRSTASIRPRLTAELLSKAVAANLAQGISGKMDVDAEPAPDASAAGQSIPAKSSVPESGFFLGLLIIVFLHDQKQYLGATALATSLVESIQALNRRTLDPIAGRIYFYYVRFYELADQVSDIRPQLLAAYRSAVLRHDDEIQATLLNALLRHYLQLNLIDQADRLVSKATFPETVGNNQAARYTYYLGRIRAIQLDYSASHRHLLQATRKAPQTNATAGFLQTATKLAVIVQLLMGEIPERALFLEPKLRTALVPYLHITQAVRVGDLAKFQETLAAYADTFRADKNLTLILRLRHNVIKAGVRRISLAYSRISLRDICLKLQLDSEEDAEYIVAKAIRDGVIDATIDHEKGFMKSNENPDIYSTTEPQSAFHQRISFCLGLHNESVKALRFPKSDANKDIATANQLLAEERKLAQDIIQAELDSEDEDTGDN